MIKISFNKGKTQYDIHDDMITVLSRLNQKTWNNIVDDMEGTVMNKMLECPSVVKDFAYAKMDVMEKGVPNLKKMFAEYHKRYVILLQYLWALGEVHPETTCFIV